MTVLRSILHITNNVLNVWNLCVCTEDIVSYRYYFWKGKHLKELHCGSKATNRRDY